MLQAISAIGVEVLINGDSRQAYARCALRLPDKCKVVAVAEPRLKTREQMVAAHNIAPEMTFNSFDEFKEASKAAIASSGKTLVDAVVVGVQDQMHISVVTELAKHGYPMLCEKPIATTPEECIEMADAVKLSGKVFGVGHGKPISDPVVPGDVQHARQFCGTRRILWR